MAGFKNMTILVGSRNWHFDGDYQFDMSAPANSVEEVLQNVYNIIVTPIGTQVLFRAFGSDQSWIDSPGNIGQLQAKVAFLLALSQWEPRVKVLSVKFQIDTTDYLAGVYHLFLEVEVDLNVTINQIIFTPPTGVPIWVIDAPFGQPLTVKEESLTL